MTNTKGDLHYISDFKLYNEGHGLPVKVPIYHVYVKTYSVETKLSSLTICSVGELFTVDRSTTDSVSIIHNLYSV